MQQDKVDMYIMTNAKFFPVEKIPLIREKMLSLDDSRFSTASYVEFKDPTTLLLVSIFLGTLGIDRFMLGDTGMGILKLLTGGLCGILTVIDWFMVQGKAREKNFNNLMMIL